MNSPTAVILACLVMVDVPAAAAQGIARERPKPEAMTADAARQTGPLRRASTDPTHVTLLAESGVAVQSPSKGPSQDRSWIERHPVWTGALIGFGVGFGLTYMSGTDGIPGPGGPALVWGGLGAGLGALTGWGISRARDDDWSAIAPGHPGR